MGNRLQVLRRLLGYRDQKSSDLPRFFVMSDEKRLPDPVALIPYLPKGCAIILRHYQAPKREQIAKRLIKAAHRREIKVLIAGGDAKQAQRCGADGVHYPEYALNKLPGKPRKPKKPWLTSAAVHNPKAAYKAKQSNIDFAVVSPIFPTESHPGATTLGPLRATKMGKLTGKRWIALGGVTEETAKQLRQSGFWGIAGIGLFKK